MYSQLQSDMIAVLVPHPEAVCVGDHTGWYIMDGLTQLGWARKQAKAWHNAAQQLTKKKRPRRAARDKE